MSEKIYSIVTEQILAALDAGVVPWRKPWGTSGLPRNGESGRAYTGINSFLLNLSEYPDPRWLTFKQIQKRGGTVYKGAKSTLVVFVKPLTVVDPDHADEGTTKDIRFLRYYRLFNVAQADGHGLPPLATNTATIIPIAEAEAVVFGSAFLCGRTGINNLVDNQASYIDNWRRVLRADAHMVIQAASAGQKAADFVLGVRV